MKVMLQGTVTICRQDYQH